MACWTSCQALGITHKFARAYRPQTNGKAERFIQSALREWAYGWTYQNSKQRTCALASWQHHYNWHRPHAAIGGAAPMSRLPASGNNVLPLHSQAPRTRPSVAQCDEPFLRQVVVQGRSFAGLAAHDVAVEAFDLQWEVGRVAQHAVGCHFRSNRSSHRFSYEGECIVAWIDHPAVLCHARLCRCARLVKG
jgi:hypothetical protein